MARNPRNRPRAPEVCPVCGADVHPNALACRECGADHQSGWREGAEVDDGLDLPDDDFDYEDFVRREFGESKKPAGLHPIWWIVAMVLLGITVLALLMGVGH